LAFCHFDLPVFRITCVRYFCVLLHKKCTRFVMSI
jgi:hypothetical protein